MLSEPHGPIFSHKVTGQQLNVNYCTPQLELSNHFKQWNCVGIPEADWHGFAFLTAGTVPEAHSQNKGTERYKYRALEEQRSEGLLSMKLSFEGLSWFLFFDCSLFRLLVVHNRPHLLHCYFFLPTHHPRGSQICNYFPFILIYLPLLCPWFEVLVQPVLVWLGPTLWLVA